MNTKESRFDDWSYVKDCNECVHYWNDTCDGVAEGSTKGCTAFQATRSVVIPKKVEKLSQAIKWLIVCDCALILWSIYHILAHAFGWYM